MGRRRVLNIPRAVEDGARLLVDHINAIKRKAEKGEPLELRVFYTLDRATERLHQLRQDTEGIFPKKLLDKLTPEELDVITGILERHGL